MARSITLLTIFLVVGLLVGCGNDSSKPLASVAQPEPAVPSPTQVALDHVGDQPLTEVEEVTAKKMADPSLPAEPKSEGTPEVYAEKPTISYDGNATMEERIATADVIAVARMDSVVASVEDYNHEGFDGGTATEQSYVATLKFTFTISRYLKGSGSSGDSVTAVVGSLWVFGDRAEAQGTADAMLAERDTQWDNRDAVIFLVSESATLPVTATDGVYFMSRWDIYTADTGDQYSIASKRNKIWLPEAQRATNSGARSPEKWFLTDVPTPGSAQQRSGSQTTDESPAIAQSALEAQITIVNNKLTAQPGRKYTMCVAFQMFWSRVVDYWQSAGLGYPIHVPVFEAEIASGLPENTPTGWGTTLFVVNADWQNKVWFEGDDADLFMLGDEKRRSDFTYSMSNSFSAGGGEFLVDAERIVKHIATARPLPAGEYTFTEKIRGLLSEPCGGHTERVVNILTVTGSPQTLYEALFDPVTDGSAVAADSSNGQLEPAAFTDANGASATIQRIEWAAGTVKVKVNPHTGLAGHKLDFIELDGTVSLSLQVDDATVDAANKTLSWTVSEQSWEDGDLLMLRIAEVVPEVALVDVPSTVTQGSSESFTLKATGLSSSNSYSIRLTSSSFAINIGNGCGISLGTLTVPAGSTSHSETVPLQGCNAGSSTITATLLQGTSTIATATAEVEVEASASVTVTLSPREERYGTYTNLAVEWYDPSGCAGRYYVGIFNSQETVVNNLGYHPAPQTTSLSQNLGRSWDDIPNLDWFVRVRCHPSHTSDYTVVGQASLQSGLPSTP